MYRQYFPAAPWSKLLTGLTLFSVLILGGVMAIGLLSGPRDLWVWHAGMVWTPAAALLISPLFMIRGYLLEDGYLRVQRLGWHSTIDLRQMESVHRDPDAMRGAWRLCGNGGLFCFAGWFRSSRLGNFRALVTSASNAVVLKTARQTWVLSPRDPEAMVAALEL